MKVNKKLLAIFIIVLIVAGIGVYWFFIAKQGTQITRTFGAEAETPYGEKLIIQLDLSGQTKQAGFLGAYTDTVSQSVWTVNGTYKSQGKITFSVSVTITGSKITNAKIENCYIKAVDTADQSSYSYTFGTYPISVSLSGYQGTWSPNSITKTLDQHVNDIQASTTCTVDYYIYCKVSAKGEVSGQTLIAEIAETKFLRLNLEKPTEQTTAQVSPSVTTSSWLEENYKFIIGFSMIAVIAVIIFVKQEESGRKCRRRRKIARKH